jgi:hypothetical protein
MDRKVPLKGLSGSLIQLVAGDRKDDKTRAKAEAYWEEKMSCSIHGDTSMRRIWPT